MSVKIDNDKVFQLNWEHGNRTVRKQLENYMRCRGINDLWLSEVIEKSVKDTKGAI